MLARLGYRVVALDYDPQCNLSALFLNDDELSELWSNPEILMRNGGKRGQTVSACVDLVRRGKGDLLEPNMIEVSENLWLMAGHIGLSKFEQTLAEEWPKIQAADNERAWDVTTALDRLSNNAAAQVDADFVLMDIGPSLGALNRAVVLACDAIIVPLAPDIFSLQGLENIGPVLRDWRRDWLRACTNHSADGTTNDLPLHEFRPIGYIVQQHLARADRIPSGYQRWATMIPDFFHRYVLGEEDVSPELKIEMDPQCLTFIKHYASLVPLAQQAGKPIFDLKQADGIGGTQQKGVSRFRKEFESTVMQICRKLDELPDAKPMQLTSPAQTPAQKAQPARSTAISKSRP